MRIAVSILLLVAALALLFSAGHRNGTLRDLRRDLRITQADPLENAPPLVAFTTVALGGFRGILADVLWMRLSRLQDEGRYFELVQLADWITKLEPRFTEVWSFQAWNLAYNVSVLFEGAPDRWRWVANGIALLRDEGLRYNPGNARLMYELGWIFQHKMGGIMDQAQAYYKKAWASEMMTLFDGPAPDYAALTAAPVTRADLLQRPGARELLARLTAAGQNPFSPSLLLPDLAPGVKAILAESPAGRDLVNHLRLRRMVDVYKLDPRIMQRIDEESGPLDWRLTQAHAIYWGWRSRQVARDFDLTNADRMIFQSLADAFRQGRLFYQAADGIFIPSPNIDLLPRVRGAYERALAENSSQETIRTAHKNFLREAILIVATYNRMAQAREIFDDLRARYPEAENAVGFEAFLVNRFQEKMQDMTDREAFALVEGAFVQGFFWQAMGETERAAGFDQLARLSWKIYMDARQDPEFRERTGLPPVEELRRLALERARGNLSRTTAATNLPAPLPVISTNAPAASPPPKP